MHPAHFQIPYFPCFLAAPEEYAPYYVNAHMQQFVYSVVFSTYLYHCMYKKKYSYI